MSKIVVCDKCMPEDAEEWTIIPILQECHRCGLIPENGAAGLHCITVADVPETR